jgi:cephalosporin-C deacetylase-like acetyl esterase
LSFIWSVNVSAQIPPEKLVKILIEPDHPTWSYKIGEKVMFKVVVNEFNIPLKNVKVHYELGQERMTPAVSRDLSLADGTLTIDGGTLNEPGFLRCLVTTEFNGNKYRNLVTVGFTPEAIKPITEFPADFLTFWNGGKKELAGFTMDNKMVLLPERCTQNVAVYQVNLQGYGKGSRIYGILCMPSKPGKYPALLEVPGAGVRPYNGDIALAERGIITLQIGIHGIPVTMEPNVYTSLAGGALSNYQNFNLDDRDKFYYKRVYLNCIRANDFLVSLPQYDGKNLGVTGGSQGGALTVVTAALDERVTCAAAMYPALCDLTATLKNRAGGWPQYFEKWNFDFNNKADKIKTCGYYDVVNFARGLKVPSFFTWGFNDEVCPPTSMYAAYNSITSPKTLLPFLDTGHWAYGEQYELLNKWLLEQLGMKQK